jgi:hypothetical protein
MMSAVREPQSYPAKTARLIRSASSSAITSRATTDCWALRNVDADRNVVVPWPRRYGTITR